MCSYAKDLFYILDNCKHEPLILPKFDSDMVVKDFVGDNKIKVESLRSNFDYDYILNNGHLTKRAKRRRHGPQIKSNNVTSFNLGKINVRKGTRPQGYFKSPQNAFDFYNQNKKVFDNYEVDLNKNVVVSGCFDTNKHTIQATAIPKDVSEANKRLPTFDDFLYYKKQIMSVVRKLKIKEIGMPTFEESLNSHFRAESQPGFLQYHINGIKTKRKAFKTSSKAAQKIYKKLDRISLFSRKELVKQFVKYKPDSKGLYTIGARNKRDYTYEDFELATSRAVHMPEFHNEIVTAGWIDGINDAIKLDKRGPIYIGNSIASFERYERDILSNNSYVEGDWRKYDSTIRVLALIICCCISRIYYRLYSKRADVHFYWIFYLHLIKDYYLPGGYVVRILNGLPSGTKCTTVWNSFFNLFALLNCCKHINSKTLNFAVGGDDFVIMCTNKLVEHDVEKIIENSSELGMEFKFCDLKSIESKSINDFPFFYKYTVKNGKPVSKAEILLERLFCPFNVKIKSSIEYFQFLDAQLPSLGFPSSTHLLYYSIYANTYNRVYNKFNNFTRMKISDVYKTHLASYGCYRYSFKRRTTIDDGLPHFKGFYLYDDEFSKFENKCVNSCLVNKNKIRVFIHKIISRDF